MPLWVDHTRRFFYVLLILVLYFAYVLFKPYLTTIFLALITVIMFQAVYSFWLKTFRKSEGLATTASIITVFIAGLMPIVLLLVVTVNQAVSFYRQARSALEGNSITMEQAIDEVNVFLERIPYLNYRLEREDLAENVTKVIEPIGSYVIEQAPGLLSLSTDLLTNLIVYVILLAAFFPGREKLINYIKQASPFDDKIDEVYLKRIIAMIKSMVKGTFVISIVQSIIAVLTLAAFGMDYLAFWFILMFFFGIVPVGVAFITYPISIFYLLIGEYAFAVILILVTTIVINNVDNILRPKLVSTDAQLHPALIILSVLGGLKVFGPMGFIYGPVVTIFIVTTFETYLKYYKKA